MKIIIVLALLAIIAALFSGLFFMLNDEGPKKRTVNALAVRVGLSVALILFLVAGYFLGWIQPHGIQP